MFSTSVEDIVAGVLVVFAKRTSYRVIVTAEGGKLEDAVLSSLNCIPVITLPAGIPAIWFAAYTTWYVPEVKLPSGIEFPPGAAVLSADGGTTAVL
jgi:hypothetical protein